jgi:CheY-like chemotaxis protein
VLELIKARGVSTPVILVTGNANEAYLKLALQAGAKDVLAKPFVKEALLDQLHKFLEKS